MESEIPEYERELLPVEPMKSTYAPARITVVIFAGLLAVAGYLCIRWYQCEQLITQLTSAKNTTIELSNTGEMLIQHWKINNLPAYISTDRNHDGNYEKSSSFDFAGNKLSEFYDENEDGYYESGIQYSPDGKVVQESYDKDEDGCWERIIVYEHALHLDSRDVNFDCKTDSVYVFRDKQLINQFSMEQLQKIYTTAFPGVDTLY